MGIFHDDCGGDLNSFGWATIIVFLIVAVFIIACGLVAWSNMSYWEGREVTVTGSIQLHQLKREVTPFYAYDYTDVEMRTYAGDNYHLTLFGHINLEYGKTYTVRYEYSNYWWHLHLVNRVIEIVELPNVS